MRCLCLLLSLALAFVSLGHAAGPPGDSDFTLARVRYGGGGDWYNDPEILPNLAEQLNSRTPVLVNGTEAAVSITDPELFNYPFLFLTGHGNVKLSEDEVKRLRRFLTTGGFLYGDDDYGMDESFRREIKRVFPDQPLVELPFEHPIYHCFYDFPHGLPKIHEHHEGPPHGYGIVYDGRLVVFYSYNSNISDGWTEAHKDPPEKREQAFRMGINIVYYALSH